MAGQGQKISGPDTKPEPECELCKTKIYYYVTVTYGHICCKAKAQSCTFQSDIVPVSDEKLAPILNTRRASDEYSRA